MHVQYLGTYIHNARHHARNMGVRHGHKPSTPQRGQQVDQKRMYKQTSGNHKTVHDRSKLDCDADRRDTNEDAQISSKALLR